MRSKTRTLRLFGVALVAALLPRQPTFLSAADADKIWSDDSWHFTARFYGWLAEAPAAISFRDQGVAERPESLDTILESLNTGAPHRQKSLRFG